MESRDETVNVTVLRAWGWRESTGDGLISGLVPRYSDRAMSLGLWGAMETRKISGASLPALNTNCKNSGSSLSYFSNTRLT